jgi:hypothetical protein
VIVLLFVRLLCWNGKLKVNLSMFCTPYVVHTLSLVLKNICAVKNIDENENVYNECNWITEVVDDVSFIKDSL